MKHTPAVSGYRPVDAGFTLIEMMITLAVLAILATIALPNFQSMIRDNRLSSQANEMITALNYARSEAIKRSSNVTLSTASASTWHNGWDVKDNNGNTLRSHDALEGKSTLSSAVNTVTYKGSGFINSSSTVTFDLCDDRSGETGRRIKISVTGRISIKQLSCS